MERGARSRLYCLIFSALSRALAALFLHAGFEVRLRWRNASAASIYSLKALFQSLSSSYFAALL